MSISLNEHKSDNETFDELIETENKKASKKDKIVSQTGEANLLSTDSSQYDIGQDKYIKEMAYAEEAKIRKTPLNSSPWSLQIEWTVNSKTPITIFRVQFMANDSTDWSEVDVVASKLDNEDWYGKADLLNLQPSTLYMVKVSSMNTEGYSQFSDVQLFATPEKGK